jgi:protease-4
MRGKNAGIFRETEKWTDAERAKMQEQANKIYFDDFVPKVSKGRGKSVEEINSIGQGHVWTGTQGKENGLVDEIGGFEKAIDIAKELAKLPADRDVKRVVFPAPRSFVEQLLGEGDDEAFAKTKEKQTVFDALPKEIQRAFRSAEIFERMQNGEAMLMLPFELEIK